MEATRDAGREADHVSVVVVAGTQTRIAHLERLLKGPGFFPVGSARDADDAELVLRRAQPSAVLLDLDLFAGGLDVIERIMATHATPIVVCGAAAEHPEAAIAAGAVDVVGPLDSPVGSAAYVEALRRHLKFASRIPVITHPRGRLRERMVSPQSGTRSTVVVAIGASTGGPPALATMLRDLPAQLGAAVVVVQHMADGFVEGLARYLDGACDLPVQVAVDGERLREDTVYLAPAGRNLIVGEGLQITLVDPPPGQFHVPGVDATFDSIAKVCGSQAIGVLLTGMGRDGAAGMKAMRDKGAFTIAQDESTSVVWGMPAAACHLDAVEVELPLPAIGAAVLDSLIHRPQRTHR